MWEGQAERVVGRSAGSVLGRIDGAKWVGEGLWEGCGGEGRGTWSRDGTGPREIGVAGDQQTTIGEENFCSSARARG